MAPTSRKYTLKEARAYSGAVTNQTTLEQAKMQELGHYVRHINKLNGTAPTLPTGVVANSDQGIQLWTKAYEAALEAEALRNWVKKTPEKHAMIQGSANGVTPRRPTVPRRTLGERRALSNKTRARVAATAASTTDTEERRVKKGIATKKDSATKRSIDEVDADDDESSPKRRRQDFAIVRSESDKENSERRTIRAHGSHAKASATSSSLKQNNGAAPTETARKIAVPFKPSQKLQITKSAASAGGASPSMPRPALTKDELNRI
ncbi:hypothetical protein LTR84_000354 [Exophiala bonariae]|uniref:Uncharacterized protein n=1 Tax=Exophiala bonariae TaxID=1690606 RepID=A0AAV9NQB0_9EURO|nr:hypothetical protein LTR84_000354 [Exophiala bonariae]